MHELKPWLQLIFRKRGRLVLGAGLLLATLLSGIALLALSGWFLTETAVVGLMFAAGIQAYINLYVPGSGIRFFAVSRTVSRYLERVYNHNTVLSLLTDIRVALFDRLALAGHRQRGERSGAQWLSRLTSDVDALDTLYLRLIAPTALAALITLLIVLLAWLLFSGLMAIVLLGMLSLALVLSTRGVYVRTRTLSAHLSDRQEALRGEVIEHLEGFAELTAAGRIGKHAGRLMRHALSLSTDQAMIDSRVGWHFAGTQLLINLAAAASLWIGLGLFQAQQVSGPVLVLLPIALLGLGEVYSMLPEAFGKFGATVSAARRLNQSTEPAAAAPVDRHEPMPTGQVLVAEDLSAGYPGQPPVLSHFTLTLNAGDRLGVVGVSGSGKSTLADTLAGVVSPLGGRFTALPCAYLTQSTVVFEDTVKANLLLGNPEATDGELWRILELVELAERFSGQGGLNAWLGAAGNRLSGGEARRLALGRVLLSKAPLVILDEPFTGVDAETRARMTPLIEQWLNGRAVISLGHGPEALLPSDRVIHLD